MTQIWFLLNLFLIFIIFVRTPKETLGLTSTINPNEFSGSPAQLEITLNIITAICVLGYFIFAFKLNINV